MHGEKFRKTSLVNSAYKEEKGCSKHFRKVPIYATHVTIVMAVSFSFQPICLESCR